MARGGKASVRELLRHTSSAGGLLKGSGDLVSGVVSQVTILIITYKPGQSYL